MQLEEGQSYCIHRHSSAPFRRFNIVYSVLYVLLLVVYFGIGLSLLWFHPQLVVYRPMTPSDARKRVHRPMDAGFAQDVSEERYIRSTDGTKLHTYMLRYVGGATETVLLPDGSTTLYTAPTLYILHGNAGNIGHRLHRARQFYRHCRCNIFLLQYRGYGLSDGTPHHRGLQQDSQAGLDYLASSANIDVGKIFVFGHSLGGAVTLDLATRNPKRIRGLVLENTFASVKALVPDLMPIYSWLAAFDIEPWDNLQAVGRLGGELPPALFIQGELDELFPQWHMNRLHEMARSLVCPGIDPAAPIAPPVQQHPQQQQGPDLPDDINDISIDPQKQGRSKHASVQPERPNPLERCRVRRLLFPLGTHIYTSCQPGFAEALAEFMQDVVALRPSK